MAIVATLAQPAADLVAVDRLSIGTAQIFPVPSFTWGVCTDVLDAVSPVEGLGAPYYVSAALVTEGVYSEPTLGQIWPRIG